MCRRRKPGRKWPGAVRGRMKQLGISAAELRRRSGLSVNTIRGITEGTTRHNRSTWVAISAVLEWPWDYLVNILNGNAGRNATAKSPMETQLAKLVDGLADIDALRQDVAVLGDIVHEIDGKIEVVIRSRHTSAGESSPEPRARHFPESTT